MNIKIIGDMPNPIHRVEIGWHSFDRAFTNPSGVLGFPVRGLVELYGATGCGKTTFALSIVGRVAQLLGKNMVFADIEGSDPEHTIRILEQINFEQGIRFISQTTDEEALDEIIGSIKEEEVSAAMFDSVGAVSPYAEQSGSIGEANMGRRAMIISQFSRKLTHIMKDYPKTSVFMINHQRQKMGSRGWETPGGVTLEYLAPVRIHVKRGEEFSDGSYTIVGTVRKNKYGFKDLEFQAFVLAHYGVSDEMTAVIDCKAKNLVQGNWRSVKIGDESFGNYQTIVAKALEGDRVFFTPFYNALKGKNDSQS